MRAFSSVVRAMMEYLEPVLTFIGDEMYDQRVMRPEACDFRFGNPQEMPLPEIQQALTRWAEPKSKDWFSYKFSDPSAVRVAVESLPQFELPIDAIEWHITPQTRAIIVNSPHNPSGRVLTPEELEQLAHVLEAAHQPIFLISDESYSRILFDGREFHSPVRYYDRSFLIYTYGKTLVAPGQRLGYIAMPPTMPDREELRTALFVSQASLGYAFPNAVMQYAMADLEKAIIDVPAMQRRRDRVVSALTEMGYETVTPEGTFYVMVRSPVADELEFTRKLADEDVFVLPGRMFELPGWFRISLTGNDSMVERALPGFERALEGIRVSKLV